MSNPHDESDPRRILRSRLNHLVFRPRRRRRGESTPYFSMPPTAAWSARRPCAVSTGDLTIPGEPIAHRIARHARSQQSFFCRDRYRNAWLNPCRRKVGAWQPRTLLTGSPNSSMARTPPNIAFTTEGVETVETPLGTMLKVSNEAIRSLTAEAMREIAHFLGPPTSHNFGQFLTTLRPAITADSLLSTC